MSNSVNVDTSIGIFIAIAGNVLISAALNLQKYVHNRQAQIAGNELVCTSHDRLRDSLTDVNQKNESNSPSTIPTTQPISVVRNSVTAEHSSNVSGNSISDQFLPHSVLCSSVSSIDMYRHQPPPLNRPHDNDHPPSPVSKCSRPDRDSIEPLLSKVISNDQSLGILPHSPSSHCSSIPSSSTTSRHQQNPSRRSVDTVTNLSFQNLTISSSKSKRYLSQPLWWVGLCLMILGEVGNFVAYGFAPASLVAPLGTMGLVANVAFASWILGERFQGKDYFGVASCVLGLTIIIVVVGTTQTVAEPTLSPEEFLRDIVQPVFIAYFVTCIVALGALISLSRWGSARRQSVWIDLTIVALFGGITVLSTKAISSFIHGVGVDMFMSWISWILIILLVGSAVLQVHYLNLALARFEARLVIPTHYVLFTTSSIVGSAVLYRDFQRISALACLGILLMFFGVYLITQPVSSTNTPTRCSSCSGSEVCNDIACTHTFDLEFGGKQAFSSSVLTSPPSHFIALPSSATLVPPQNIAGSTSGDSWMPEPSFNRIGQLAVRRGQDPISWHPDSFKGFQFLDNHLVSTQPTNPSHPVQFTSLKGFGGSGAVRTVTFDLSKAKHVHSSPTDPASWMAKSVLSYPQFSPTLSRINCVTPLRTSNEERSSSTLSRTHTDHSISRCSSAASSLSTCNPNDDLLENDNNPWDEGGTPIQSEEITIKTTEPDVASCESDLSYHDLDLGHHDPAP